MATPDFNCHEYDLLTDAVSIFNLGVSMATHNVLVWAHSYILNFTFANICEHLRSANADYQNK